MRPGFTFALAAILLLSVTCLGQGVIAPRRHHSVEQLPPEARPVEVKPQDKSVLPAALPVSSIKITARIDGQVATIKVEHLFRNDTDETLEGTYYFPVPEGASLVEFAVYDGDQRRLGRVKEKEEARAAYSAGVSQGEDPAVLEMTRRGWFQSHVYPIPARTDKRIEIIYSQLLSEKDGVITFDYPLGKGYKKLKVPVGNVEVDIDLRADTAIKNLFSPTHPLDVNHDGDRHVTARIGTIGGEDAENFQLLYSLSDEDVGMSLLTYRREGEDGYFLLMLSPKIDFDERRISAKDVIFVIDVSGSMKGEKLEQAKGALTFGLRRTLKEEDRFNIISFSSRVDLMSPRMLPANRANIERALRFVNELNADGGTNINDSLVTAMGMFARSGRPQNLVFLTDGQPTESVTSVERIIENTRAANAANVRLFTFGVGSDVNRALLERLAVENRGAESNIADQVELEATVSTFFARVSRPVLSDLHVDFGPLQTANLYPAQLPDLYTRSQVKIFGRYRNPEDLRNITISLAGQMRERPERFEFNGLNFPLVTEDKEFLPKLWATERVNALLSEIRLYGEKPELKEEVIDLARKFNLVTPYTSMYVPTSGELARERENAKVVRDGTADVTMRIQERPEGQAGPIPNSPPASPSAGSGSGVGMGVGRGRAPEGSFGGRANSLPLNGRGFTNLVQPSPGTVVDPTGAAIPGATVTIKDQNTGATRTVTTDESGNYSVAGLPPGEYKIEVAATGFNKTTVNNVVVQPGQVAAAGVELSVGSTSETVNVTSVAPAIDASISNNVSSVESRKLRDLPSLDPVDSFSRLAPGVEAQRPDDSRQSSAGTRDAELRFWINGGRFRANNYTLNGQDNNDIDGRPAISVNNFDSLDTLNIVTTRGSGDVSATGASSINLISRTGTNEFHGTAFDYYLNRKFGALSPLERRSGLDRAPAFRSDLFGGTFGGPIRRDRIFFFGAFQGENEDSHRFTDSTSSFLTPTERGLAELARVFSNSPTVMDLIARGPFARGLGEQRFGRSLSVLVLGTPIEFGQMLRVIPSSVEGYEAGGRFDFLVTNRDTLKASYWWDSRRATNAIGRHSAGFLGDTDNRAQLGGLHWNRTLSPRSTSELGFAFNRSRLSLDSDEGETLGVSVGMRGLPYGPSPLLPAGHTSTSFGISETLTHVAGRHNIRIGGQVRRRLTSFDYLPGAAGNFSYPSFEDFVLNRPMALVFAAGERLHRFEETRQHYFIDDAWRARSNLTFTMGMGYENGGQPLNGLADRLRNRESSPATALFDPSLAIETRTITKVNRDNNNLTPRLGFAYTPQFRIGGLNLFGYDQTVIRAGASVSYDQTAYRPLADVATSTPNVMLAVITPDFGVAVPTFPNLPGRSDLASLFRTDPSIFARTELDREFRTPFSATWHLAISRELKEKATLEIAYVGSRGVGLIRALDANPLLAEPQRGPTRVYATTGRSIYHSLQARADLRLTGGVTGGIAYTLSKLIDDVPGSAAQIAGGIGSPATLTLPELQHFAQNPADGSRGERALSDLDRRHSLVGHIVWTLPLKRLQGGVAERLLGGWQVSGIVELRSGTPFTPLQHFGYSPASSAIFASAFSERLGSVRPFAGNAAAGTDSVAFSNAANEAFGFFLNSDGTRFISPSGFIVADRSGFRAGSPQDARFIYNDDAVERRAVAMGLAPDAFGKTYAAGRPFGNVGRNTLIGPGLANIDFALVKTTKLSEKVSLQIRAEAFNLFNHPNRGRPNFVLENAGGFGFGDLGEVDSTPRRVRFALKLIF